jgi:hypothetical protein
MFMRATACVALLLIVVSTPLIVAKDAAEPVRYYFVEANVISLDAKNSLSSYRSEGRLTGTPGATLGASTPDTGISIVLSVEAEHFYADVELKPNAKGADQASTKERVDLTALRPKTIEVGSKKDGRTYQLHLIPSVKTIPAKPKPFQEIANDLYQLKFHSSRVMLNDKQYIGRMLSSDSDRFWVDICGVANLEFSLHRFKGAEPWGQLESGQISLRNPDGTTIEFSNVTNGTDDRVVEGGPYTVWVHWQQPHATVEEFRAAVKAQREQLRESASDAGAGDTVAQSLKVLDDELSREPGPWVTSCGAGDLPKSEIVRDE